MSNDSYYRIPKFLFFDERYSSMSDSAKLLYSLILDHFETALAVGQVDEQGNAFIHLSVRDIAKNLFCGRDKATNLLIELGSEKGVGLINRISHGVGKTASIYINPIDAIQKNGGTHHE